MKRCTRCGVERPLDQFPPVRKGEAKLQSWCRSCFAEVTAAYYARNREREKARLVAYTNVRRDENRRNIVAYLLAHPCVDCGENDIVVLEFDHREGKLRDIAKYANSGRTWATVLREIEKCDVRCANCHRRETARRTAQRNVVSPARRRRTAVQLELTSAIEYRRCRVCGVRRSLAHFPFRSKREGTRQAICLECQREMTAAWYARLVGHPARPQRARGTASREVLERAVFAYLIEHPCIDCGERDPIVLDFDHRGDKVDNVSTLVRNRADLPTIAAEIAKCDVRCANCHRRKTVGDVGGYRLRA